MKDEVLLWAFFIFSTLALVGTWFYLSPPTLQISGAFSGDSAPDLVTPLMASLLVVWFLLVVFVMYFNRRLH